VKFSYAIAVAVGPDPKELDRIADLVASVRAYETHPCLLVMVNDAPARRSLGDHFEVPPGWMIVQPQHPRQEHSERAAKAQRGKGICAAILQALRTIADHGQDVRFVLKMDTDALVIAPFYDKLIAAIEQHPDAGMIGAHDHTPSGTVRDISKNATTVQGLYQPASFVERVRNLFSSDEGAKISRHISAALRNGYRFGEHCLGGAYAVSGEMLRRLKAAGYLDDPSLWLPIDCPEDVMVGIYTKAVGCDFLSFVAENQVFGVRHKGLDDTPQRLVERGYSVIHAVKNDTQFTEEQIREFFRKRRESKP
jgi:hypothetical protein